ncbi:MAG TPA: mechanosensitive ion channel domain-containing protein [Chitinophagales bacterium]|nr:mechanosensitive ion channel domain-containing protein [Chitinophagales bacterium]
MNSEIIEDTAHAISKITYQFLINNGVNERIVFYINAVLLFSIVCLLVFLIQFFVRRVIRKTLTKVSQKSEYTFFDHLLANKFPHYLALIAPISLVKNSVEIVFVDFPKWIPVFDKLVDIYIIFALIKIITSILYSCADLLKEHPAYSGKPLDSYIQVIKLVLYLFGAIILFSMLTGKSPLTFFTAMGAMSAVLLLMFKDTIMGFVASIQVTTNDMVKIGDWVTISKYGADGDVIEINLTTVKIQNFDKTITTIPTYALTSESFQNWRGMQQAGGRRIKRSIFIKQASVRFIDDSEIEGFKRIEGIKDYVEQRSQEIHLYNEKKGANKDLKVNGRNLTNMGIFRKYVDWYIATNPNIHHDMTHIVRQLPPEDKGIPLEIYVFANTTDWKEYENIMSDFFDHVTASVKYFDLEIFESANNSMNISQDQLSTSNAASK